MMFKTLEIFKTVYETKNFTTAAQLLFLSQPTVSVQIKQLEESLDVVLFERNGRQANRAHQTGGFILRAMPGNYWIYGTKISINYNIKKGRLKSPAGLSLHTPRRPTSYRHYLVATVML
ncbi:LysR family transcriptional regulator [Latilactobacillus sakei]